MKSIELCKRLLDGLVNIDNAGMMMMFPTEPTSPENFLDSYCQGYFGTYNGKWEGKRYAGEMYFYMYIPAESEEAAYRLVGELPDAYCHRKEENDIVALWRVE